ncbi:MAG: DUF3006 domain-containing protein [Oscillospiraceae bacterium]|jgi:hypothetical protein|nr:DUF3006 domain-containing protein [Oscillospiraceae bacterium]
MRYIVDRIEGGLAVCEREDGGLEEFPLRELPQGVREGGVLVLQGGAWVLDLQAEQERRARLFERQEGLFS